MLKQKRRKMNIEEIFDNDSYRSIIALTMEFADKKGLRQLFYRWFLIKNHDNIKSTSLIKTYHLKDKFIIERIEQLKALGLLVENRITSNKSLNKFIGKLVNDYELLEPVSEKPFKSYTITSKVRPEIFRWFILYSIKELPEEYITEDLYNKIGEFILKVIGQRMIKDLF